MHGKANRDKTDNKSITLLKNWHYYMGLNLEIKLALARQRKKGMILESSLIPELLLHQDQPKVLQILTAKLVVPLDKQRGQSNYMAMCVISSKFCARG